MRALTGTTITDQHQLEAGDTVVRLHLFSCSSKGQRGGAAEGGGRGPGELAGGGGHSGTRGAPRGGQAMGQQRRWGPRVPDAPWGPVPPPVVSGGSARQGSGPRGGGGEAPGALLWVTVPFPHCLKQLHRLPGLVLGSDEVRTFPTAQAPFPERRGRSGHRGGVNFPEHPLHEIFHRMFWK